jgi:hypothetical protein
VNWFNVLIATPRPLPRATNPSHDNGFENFGFRIADFEISNPQSAIENQTTDSDDFKSEIRNPNSEILLSFRELKTLASALLAILLALFDARVARDQTGLLQGGTKVSIEFH